MESQPQNPEFRNNPETFTHEDLRICAMPIFLTRDTELCPFKRTFITAKKEKRNLTLL